MLREYWQYEHRVGSTGSIRNIEHRNSSDYRLYPCSLPRKPASARKERSRIPVVPALHTPETLAVLSSTPDLFPPRTYTSNRRSWGRPCTRYVFSRKKNNGHVSSTKRSIERDSMHYTPEHATHIESIEVPSASMRSITPPLPDEHLSVRMQYALYRTPIPLKY